LHGARLLVQRGVGAEPNVNSAGAGGGASVPLTAKRWLPCKCNAADAAEGMAETLDAHLAWTTGTMAGSCARTQLASTGPNSSGVGARQLSWAAR